MLAMSLLVVSLSNLSYWLRVLVTLQLLQVMSLSRYFSSNPL